MSGHSHWAGIKYKKAVNDAKRGKIWSKLARVIIVAAKSGGGDPTQNLALRYAIDKAKSANMPKDTIEKAIKKGTGEVEGVSFEEVLYEGYGPSGVAIMVEALTDNRNRTAPEMKRLFEKHNGSLGTSGCVNWMFSKKGLITVAADQTDEEQLMEIALAAGADDMQTIGGVYEITCEPNAYEKLKDTLKEKDIATQVAEISMVPQNTVPVKDEAAAKKIISLMEAFEDHDDVQNVYANFDIPDEIMARIS
jgi:YebC/PmpR family DNA-binding regulatory protein